MSLCLSLWHGFLLREVISLLLEERKLGIPRIRKTVSIIYIPKSNICMPVIFLYQITLGIISSSHSPCICIYMFILNRDKLGMACMYIGVTCSALSCMCALRPTHARCAYTPHLEKACHGDWHHSWPRQASWAWPWLARTGTGASWASHCLLLTLISSPLTTSHISSPSRTGQNKYNV